METLRDCRTVARSRAHAPAIDGCERGERHKGRELNGEPEGKGEACFGRRLHRMEDERQKTEGYQKSQGVAAAGNYTEFLEGSAIDEAKENYCGVQDEQESGQSFFEAYGHTRMARPHG
jgi:hypothetical protein